MRKITMLQLLAAMALVSASAACSSPTSVADAGKPTGFYAPAWVDSALYPGLQDRGDTIVTNTPKGWSR